MAVSVVLVFLLPAENGRLGWVSQNKDGVFRGFPNQHYVLHIVIFLYVVCVLITTPNNQNNEQMFSTVKILP